MNSEDIIMGAYLGVKSLFFPIYIEKWDGVVRALLALTLLLMGVSKWLL